MKTPNTKALEAIKNALPAGTRDDWCATALNTRLSFADMITRNGYSPEEAAEAFVSS